MTGGAGVGKRGKLCSGQKGKGGHKRDTVLKREGG